MSRRARQSQPVPHLALSKLVGVTTAVAADGVGGSLVDDGLLGLETGLLAGDRLLVELSHAYVIIHGKLRNGGHYWKILNDAVNEARKDGFPGADRNLTVVAPQFFSTRYNSNQYTEDQLAWGDLNAWQAGEPATHPVGTRITSIDALDAIVEEFSNQSRYPKIRNITVVGHGGGGQLAQRYATVAQESAPHVHIRYIHAGPGSTILNIASISLTNSAPIAMYASRTICSRCSSQLRPIVAQRLGVAARFATLNDSSNASQPLPTHSHESEAQRRPARSRPGPSNGPANGLQDPSFALFNDVVSPVANDSSSGDLAARPVLGELEIVAKVDELMKKGLTLKDEYELFRKDIWPHIKEMRGEVPGPIYKAASLVLGKMRTQLAYVSDTSGISVELGEMYSILGKWDPSIRNDLVLNLCSVLIEVKNPSSRRSALMNELVTLWMHISQLKRSSEVLQEPRFALPSAQDVLKDLNRRQPKPGQELRPLTLDRALESIFLVFPPAQAEALLPGLLATVAVLSDGRFSGPGLQTKAAPLLNLVRLVLTKVKNGFNEAEITEIFKLRSKYPMGKQQKLRAYVVRQLTNITKMLLYRSDQWQGGLDNTMDPEMAKAMSLTTFHRQLRIAYRARNTGAVFSIWQNLLSCLQDYPRLAQDIRDDPHFLDFWIFVWCGVRRANRLQDTMDLMKELEIEPTVKTYTAMLHGWKLCKDVGKIEALWGQLIQSGMKLDVIIWTERVAALIDGGRPQEGVDALIQMVAIWKQAVKDGHQSDAVEPTISVVNAAFSALLRHGDPQKANQVLAWAGREGFTPDVRTYNILIRESLRADDPEDAKDLLRSMKNQDIQPDSATFTILLEGVITRMGDEASPAEQVHAVDQVFADIEAANLKPNQETYGKMLYSVASLPNGSEEAIAAVQAHMRGKGITVTAHMVTILVERALSRDPPDIHAVRDLLREHKLKSVDQGDQTLWERVMSAFSVAGEPAEALAIFDDLANAGRPVTSLPCLLDLVRMLIEKEDRPAAERVVSVALAHKLKTKEEFNARYWRHHFWYMAKENGLLKTAELPEEVIKHFRG
ncbi:hypothetical protein G7Z17_g12827 [Cylindrodendrum hubeiense]|uniref:Uncharacterized protein n=1 Tax=Cylindrodendrum hubeiense TaxID=595255 RepID=A0A9P5GTB2_9HYPO|nr:hypothetical protein G7Z17_g12827 [Cylindrodendrum hubeiense]